MWTSTYEYPPTPQLSQLGSALILLDFLHIEQIDEYEVDSNDGAPSSHDKDDEFGGVSELQSWGQLFKALSALTLG